MRAARVQIVHRELGRNEPCQSPAGLASHKPTRFPEQQGVSEGEPSTDVHAAINAPCPPSGCHLQWQCGTPSTTGSSVTLHWIVGRPAIRNCEASTPNGCGQPSGDSSQLSCRP